jgi:hypothetical protein
VAEVASVTAKVTEIDYQARTVQLTEPDGTVRSITVDRSARNFNRVKKGDTVTMDLDQAITVEVQPGPGETMNVGAESQSGALQGERPAGVRIIEGKLKTRVEAIDYEARTFTCKNRNGVLTTYKVSPDVKRFNEVRRGDMLVVEYRQSLAISVK